QARIFSFRGCSKITERVESFIMGLIHRKESITITEYRHGERANYLHAFSRLYCCKYGGSLKPIVGGGYCFMHSHYLAALAVRYKLNYVLNN
ncbi:MAG: hypothetical protein ACRDCV_11060, partial [Plesiomonas shigelloides]